MASSCVDHTLRHAIEGALGREPLRILEQSPGGISVVLDPTGTPLGDALSRDEGILYAEIDLAQSVEPKQFHDVVGSYNRFDIFALSVNRSARRPATFVDERQDQSICLERQGEDAVLLHQDWAERRHVLTTADLVRQ